MPVLHWVSPRAIYSRDLLRELVVRDMKLRYKRSALGVAWSLLNPLAQVLVFNLVFDSVLSLGIPNYPTFAIVGVLAWNWFQSGVILATSSVTGNRELVKRPGFPVKILPAATVTTQLVHFLLALPVPLLFVVAGGGHLTAAILLLPVVISLQFLLILGMAYLVAVAQVTFRDTQHLLTVLLMLGFYLTPIFYDSAGVPDRFNVIYRVNPMVHIVEAYRAILIGGRVPDLRALMLIALPVGLLLWAGTAIFAKASHRFAEEL
jgi:lipopolysaccharide transport system permease protein